MAKNIVLFVDGTWNTPTGTERTTPTNVHKLYDLVSGSASQTKDYLAGVGTGEFEDRGELRPPSRARQFFRRLSRFGRPLLALPFGWGTKRRITRAYEFLSSQYSSGDHVYLFGFSRGAFAARSLAGLSTRWACCSSARSTSSRKPMPCTKRAPLATNQLWIASSAT